MKIRKGDTVILLSGKDRGKSGMVSRVFPKMDKVIVEGINVVKRHQKANRSGSKGQIIEKALPVHISNVAFKDPKSGKATRVGFKKNSKGTKVRIAKKGKSEI